MSISISQPCGIGTGAQLVDGELLTDRWATWSPAERRQFVDGVTALGWVPAGGVDFESPTYPGFVAMPGNPCYAGMTAPGDFGTRPPDALFQGTPVARLSDLVARLRDLASRLVGAVGDALRRALEAAGRLLGLGLSELGLLLALALLAGGAFLIYRSRDA